MGTELVFPAIVLSVVGFVAPYLIQLVVKAVSESWARYLIAVGLSGLMGIIGALILGINFSLTNIAIVVPSVITLSSTAWKLWWHKIFKSD